jgi:hypothetical protein
MDALQRLGIDPVGMAEVAGVFTRHIEVPDPAAPQRAYEKADLDEPVAVQPTRSPELGEPDERASVPPRIVLRTAGTTPELPFVEPVPDVPVPSVEAEEAAAGLETVFADLDGVFVEVGDLVFIRYHDQPERTFSVRLSHTIDDPDEGIVHVDRAPLGAAILGASLDEQVIVRIGNRTRTAVIEKIEKARDELLAAE